MNRPEGKIDLACIGFARRFDSAFCQVDLEVRVGHGICFNAANPIYPSSIGDNSLGEYKLFRTDN